MSAHRKNPNPKKQKKQKKNKFLLGVLSLTVITLASCSNWGFPEPDDLSIPNWGKSTTTAPDQSQFKATAMDADGNIIAVGSQSKNGIYGYGDGVTATGAYTGGENALIVKYNALNGKTLWAKSTTTASDGSMFNAVASDKDGNIYAVGYQNKNGLFGYGNGVTVSGGYSAASGSKANSVLVKYNSDGQAIWARSVNPAPGASIFTGVAVDKDGNIYAVGYQHTNGSFNYGNGITVKGAALINPVIVKYSSNGQAIWAKSTESGTTYNSGSFFSGITIDSSNNIYVVGTGDETLNFGNGVQVRVAYSRGGEGDALIVKYNSSGTALWARSTVTATAESHFYKVTVDKYGNVYAVGYQDDKDFNYGNGVTVQGKRALIVKYSKYGYTLWGKSVSTSGYSQFNGVATTFAGDAYAVGSQDSNDFDYGNGVTVKGTGSSSNAVLVAYNTDGKTLWAKTTTKGTEFSTFNGIVAGDYKLFVVGSQKKNGEFNYGNGAGDIKGAYAGGNNAVITTFKH